MPSDLIRGCAAVFPKEARPNNQLGSFLDSAKRGTTLDVLDRQAEQQDTLCPLLRVRVAGLSRTRTSLATPAVTATNSLRLPAPHMP
jgi:hypothetical protein